MAGRTLESLPTELLLEIGTHLDKPSTVFTVMVLNRNFYALVRKNQARLITDTLANLVTPELLPQVLAVFEASKVESWTAERTSHTISQFKGARYINRARLSVKDGLIIQRRHENILPVINDFVEGALKNHPKVLVEPMPLSKNERLRVEQSFYRFELCANIFRQHVLDKDQNPTCATCENCKKLTRSSIIQVILFLFSKIELEQLVIAIEFIQEHKHRYGVKWEWDITEAWMGPTASRAWSKRVVSFFSAPVAQQSSSSHTHDTLGLDLESADFTEGVNSLIIASYGGFIPPDTDRGPENALRWAHRYMRNHGLDALIYLEHKRYWGYALWNEKRLQDEWGLVGSVETPRA